MDNEKQQQEWEFVMEGITTRMQMAMEKLSESNKNAMDKITESNKMLHSTVKFVCIAMLVVVLSLVINNAIWIRHVNNLRSTTYVSEEVTDATIPQFGSGTNDR